MPVWAGVKQVKVNAITVFLAIVDDEDSENVNTFDVLVVKLTVLSVVVIYARFCSIPVENVKTVIDPGGRSTPTVYTTWNWVPAVYTVKLLLGIVALKTRAL